MSERQSDVLAAVHVWAATAWADGVLADEEKSAIKGVIENSRLDDAERQKALGWLDEKVDLDEGYVSALSGDDRKNIYAAALGVVTVDNEVADSEKKFLERLRGALGLDDDTASELHRQAGLD